MNTDLTNLTDEQLEAELAKRAKSAKPKPIPLKDIKIAEFGYIHRMCTDYIDGIDKNGYEDGSMRDQVFEDAVERVFGSEIFDWVNSKI